MLRTTGSKRISVVIQDKKGRYSIAEKEEAVEDPIEFPYYTESDACRMEIRVVLDNTG